MCSSDLWASNLIAASMVSMALAGKVVAAAGGIGWPRCGRGRIVASLRNGKSVNRLAKHSHSAGHAHEKGHDHEHCIEDAVAAAERLCAKKGLRFTPLRKRVLELVWSSHKPVGAYALLDSLRDEDLGSAPPTVYRALDRKSTCLNSSHVSESRMPSSA